jgi:hypothetical protein
MLMEFKTFLRFKDGFVFKGDVFYENSIPGDGKFFEMIVKRCEEDADITMHPENGPEVKRKYRDLSSVEILFL